MPVLPESQPQGSAIDIEQPQSNKHRYANPNNNQATFEINLNKLNQSGLKSRLLLRDEESTDETSELGSSYNNNKFLTLLQNFDDDYSTFIH